MAEEVTETLFICREVNVYKIPPRFSQEGHKSGTWNVADKIFTGRLRLTAAGEDCNISLEDSSGTEFAACPVPAGERPQAVEPVTDSSRYFVLRLLDPSHPQRRAFVGLGFNDRSEAFDFNVALSDHEKHIQRAKEAAKAAQMAATAGPDAAASQLHTDAASLYQSHDLRLKEGETIRINVKRPSTGGGFVSGNSAAFSSSTAPQPTVPLSVLQSSQQPKPLQQTGVEDLLGLLQPPPSSGSTVQPGPKVNASTEDNWATF